MEEFRPLIADSVVLNAVNTGVVRRDDFVTRGGAVSLSDSGRGRFLHAYERRMDELVTHPIFGYRISYRRVLEVQARLLARFLGGEIPEYPGFHTRLNHAQRVPRVLRRLQRQAPEAGLQGHARSVGRRVESNLRVERGRMT
jgi:hypothetical protein